MEEVIIQKNDANQRLDKFLGKAYPNLKKSAMHKAIRNKKIKVNRKRAQFDQILMEGDHILLFLPPDFLEKPQKVVLNLPKPNIVYEDDQFLAMNKPAGLLSMKDKAEYQDTLNDRLLFYLQQSGQYNPQIEHSFTPSIAHRLDRNTSGLVLAGKTANAARHLTKAIADHQIHKYYLAITDRKPVQGEITLYLKKEGTKALISPTPKPEYDLAQMTIHTLQESHGQYLSQIKLHSGRFHQIRACLAFLGTPLIGDVKYGGTPSEKGYQLQAYKIEFENAGFFKPQTIELPKTQQLTL